jgi:hypothetical protein
MSYYMLDFSSKISGTKPLIGPFIQDDDDDEASSAITDLGEFPESTGVSVEFFLWSNLLQ